VIQQWTDNGSSAQRWRLDLLLEPPTAVAAVDHDHGGQIALTLVSQSAMATGQTGP
jgi:hypothetical protein